MTARAKRMVWMLGIPGALVALLTVGSAASPHLPATRERVDSLEAKVRSEIGRVDVRIDSIADPLKYLTCESLEKNEGRDATACRYLLRNPTDYLPRAGAR